MIRFVLVVLCLLATSIVETRQAAAESIEYVFGASSPGDKGFDFSSLKNHPSVKSQRDGGYQVSHVSKKTTLPTIGGKARFGLRGDFEIELLFDVQTLEVPTTGDGSGIMVRIEFADRDQSGLTMALNASPNELLFWQLDFTRHGQEEHEVTKRPAFTNVFESPQRIQITRRGGDITAIVGASENSMTFESPTSSSTDVSNVAVWINTGNAPADLAIDLSKIRIEADQFANDITVPSAVSTWTIVFWIFVLMLTAVGSYWFWRTVRG
jgi:hypothetical protein